MAENTQTLTQEYQQLLYSLFQQYLFSLEGTQLKGVNSINEEFISKSEIIEKSVELLNELGKLMSEDRRLKIEDNTIENSSVS